MTSATNSIDAHRPVSRPTARLPLKAFALSLGLFFAISFSICVAFDLVFPSMAMHEVWMGLLPGFTWLSFPSFLLGLVESFAYGAYIALVFGPIYNFLAGRSV